VCVCLHVCACVRACVVCVCAYVCAFVCVCCTCFVSSSFLPRGGGHGAARTSLAPVCALDTVWECKGTEWPSKTPTTNATHAGFPGSPKHYVEEQTVVLVSSFKVQNTAQTCYFSSRRAVCAGQHQPHQSTVSTAGFPAGGSRGSRSYSYCSCGA